MEMRTTIEATMMQVAAEQSRAMPPLTDDLPLVDCGLDSLGLAVVVARLEEKFGVDPFSTAPDGAFPVTVGDLVALYQNAAK